ncbi:MAG: hypothetical protein Q8O43_00245 [Dehalococcoidia bacterium]|nr:hypothetical protein [Dehalococcoidia bacterium]
MKEIPFSVPVSGIIRLGDNNTITIIVNRTSTNVQLEMGTESPERTVFEPGTNMFDILLESAREFLRRKTYNRFTVGQLFAIARESYPGLNKRSFMARLTGATPNHPSYKHHVSHRDYFSRIAPGIFSLENQYLPKSSLIDVDSSDLGSLRPNIR